MKAVILAAGYDPGLVPDAPARPKTLVPVAGVPILRRTLTLLQRFGVEQVVIVVGHLADQVRAAVTSWWPDLDVTYVDNPAFRTTSTAASLALARPYLLGHPFLLIDGDVVFEPAVMTRVVEGGPDAVAVRSVGTLGAEEVKVVADAGDRVVALGKDVPVRGAMGEAIGIQLLSAATSRRLFAAMALRPHADLYYEDVLQDLVLAGVGLQAVDIGSAYACEIDTAADLREADAHLAAQPAFDPRAPARLAV
ncbi:MAG: phosphocholine cytidylyltransferase family protein [Kofleriaceae bacterium]